MDEIKAVEFVAEVRQVKTMADHTVNLTLNLPEYCVKQAAWFMQHQGEMIKGVLILVDNRAIDDNESERTGSNY